MTATMEKTKEHKDTVEQLLEQFRPFLEKAVNDGIRIGAESTRRTLAAQLMDTMVPSNEGAPKKRDKTVKHAIHCPVKDCARPGIKPLNNFCQHHFESLPREKRMKLRAEQLRRRKAEAAKVSKKTEETSSGEPPKATAA